MPDQGTEAPIGLRITLPRNLIFWMLIVWGAFVAAFIFLPDHRTTVVHAASSLGGLGALAGAVYLARGLLLTAQQQRDAMRQKELENAFRYLERWNNPQFHHVKMAAGKVIEIRENQDAQAVTARVTQDDTFRSNVTDVINFFEEMAIANDAKIVDEAMLRRTFRGLVHLYWMALQDFAEQRRQRFNNPRIFREVERLHQRWSENQS